MLYWSMGQVVGEHTIMVKKPWFCPKAMEIHCKGF